MKKGPTGQKWPFAATKDHTFIKICANCSKFAKILPSVATKKIVKIGLSQENSSEFPLEVKEKCSHPKFSSRVTVAHTQYRSVNEARFKISYLFRKYSLPGVSGSCNIPKIADLLFYSVRGLPSPSSAVIRTKYKLNSYPIFAKA